MKAQELRNKKPEELKKELEALLREQFNLRMQKTSDQAPRARTLTKVRRDVARIKTILRENQEKSS